VTARYGGRTQAQEATARSSFYSANDGHLHFGLGAATAADLTIRWPNGATENIANVEAGQLVVIREGAGIVCRQKFGRRISRTTDFTDQRATDFTDYTDITYSEPQIHADERRLYLRDARSVAP
jgi:ASPIC and UnbV